jgi:hypothetical protein
MANTTVRLYIRCAAGYSTPPKKPFDLPPGQTYYLVWFEGPRKRIRSVGIHVSAELLDRALSVMNTLLFALEEEGLEVSVKEKPRSVVAFGQAIRFGIAEDLQINEKRKEPSYSGTKNRHEGFRETLTSPSQLGWASYLRDFASSAVAESGTLTEAKLSHM